MFISPPTPTFLQPTLVTDGDEAMCPWQCHAWCGERVCWYFCFVITLKRAGHHLGSLSEIGRAPGLSPSLLTGLSVWYCNCRPDVLNWLVSVNQGGGGAEQRATMATQVTHGLVCLWLLGWTPVKHVVYLPRPGCLDSPSHCRHWTSPTTS